MQVCFLNHITPEFMKSPSSTEISWLTRYASGDTKKERPRSKKLDPFRSISGVCQNVL